MSNRKDKSEQEILTEALDHGRLRRVKGAAHEIRAAREAAGNYLKKNARINIRLSEPDLNLLKRKAVEEGMPYQTLIASVLHKFVTGRLQSAG